MTLPELAEFIKGVGFPIAVALFVLMRIEPRISELTKALQDLRVVLAQHNAADEARAQQARAAAGG